MNLIEQNHKSIILIHDYTQVQNTLKVLPSLLQSESIIPYSIFHASDFQPTLIQEIKKKIEDLKG